MERKTIKGKIFFIKNKIFNKTFVRKKSRLKHLHYLILFILFIFLSNIVIKILIKNKKNEELRNQMFEILSRYAHRKITSLDNVYIGYYYRLGNGLLALNKVLFYCEILQCDRIFLHKHFSPFIKNTIYDKKYGLTIEILTDSIKKDLHSLFFGLILIILL